MHITFSNRGDNKTFKKEAENIFVLYFSLWINYPNQVIAELNKVSAKWFVFEDLKYYDSFFITE